MDGEPLTARKVTDIMSNDVTAPGGDSHFEQQLIPWVSEGRAPEVKYRVVFTQGAQIVEDGIDVSGREVDNTRLPFQDLFVLEDQRYREDGGCPSLVDEL